MGIMPSKLWFSKFEPYSHRNLTLTHKCTDKGRRTMLMPTTNKKGQGVTIIQTADLTSKAQACEVGGRTSIQHKHIFVISTSDEVHAILIKSMGKKQTQKVTARSYFVSWHLKIHSVCPSPSPPPPPAKPFLVSLTLTLLQPNMTS